MDITAVTLDVGRNTRVRRVHVGGAWQESHSRNELRWQGPFCKRSFDTYTRRLS
jgi:hypothetical protein